MWRIQEKKSQEWWIKFTLNFAIHIHDQSTKHLSGIAFIDCLIEMCVLIVSRKDFEQSIKQIHNELFLKNRQV